MFRLAAGGEAVTVLRPSTAYDGDMDEVVEYAEERVGNVLFGQLATSSVDEDARYHGTLATYTLAFPKGFSGSLRGCKVRREADGEVFDVVGDPRPVPATVCPTPWNVAVEVVSANG